MLQKIRRTVFLACILFCLVVTPALAAYNTVPEKPYPKLESAEIISGDSTDVEIELKFSNNVAAISEQQEGRYDMTGVNERNLEQFSMQEAETGEKVEIEVSRDPDAEMHSEASKYFYVAATGLDPEKEYIITVNEELYANMGNSLGVDYEVTFCISTGDCDFEPTDDLPSEDVVQPLRFEKGSIETGAKDVPVDATFVLTFSNNVSGVEVFTHNSSCVKLFQDNSALVEIEVLPGEDDDVKSLIVKPKQDLAYETEYQIVVEKDLMAKNGESLSSPVGLSFETAAKSGGSSGGSGGSSGGSGGSGSATEEEENNNPTEPGQGENPGEEPAEQEVYFSDVKGSWAEEDINRLAEKEIVSGNPDGTFAPNANMTRAEGITMLVRALGINGGTATGFADVDGHWAKEYIMAAEAAGIANGTDDTHFSPDTVITREEFATLLVRAGQLTAGTEVVTFQDQEKISDWAKEGVTIASSNGLIQGYEDGTFGPQQNVTRAEACRMICNLLALQEAAATA